MILQKSFKYADLVLQKHFLLLSMLKTVVLLNIFVETDIFSGVSEDRKQFLIYKKYNYFVPL